MAEEALNPFLSRVLNTKQIEYRDNHLFLMGVPSFIFALNNLVVMQKMLEEEFGQKGLSVMYQFLGFQSRMGAKLMMNRFGFSVEKGMQEQLGQSDMVGAGKLEFVRADTKNNHFILRSKSTFAQEYLNTFGIQKDPVCWMFKGGITELISEYVKRDDLVCIETGCMAQGKQYCEFVLRPKNEFDVNDPAIKKQLPLPFKFDFSALIAKQTQGMPKRA